MIIKRIFGRTLNDTCFLGLITGSVLTALAISFGMIYILKFFDITINPAIPSAVAAVGAAIFAARYKTNRDK